MNHRRSLGRPVHRGASSHGAGRSIALILTVSAALLCLAPSVDASATPRTADPTLSAATAALPSYASTLGSAGLRSFALAKTSAGIFAAISYNTGKHPSDYVGWVRVARYAGGHWGKVATLPLFDGTQVAGPRLDPIVVDRITGAASPEFGISVEFGDAEGYQELTAAGGHWRFLAFLGRSTPFAGMTAAFPYEGRSVSGHSLTIKWGCRPDCGDKATRYVYGPRSHQLVAQP